MMRVLVPAAVALLAISLVVPWAGYEAEGNFSIQGCSGQAAKADFHLFYFTRTLVGDAPCPIFHVPYSLDSQDGKAGIEVLRVGAPLVLAGTVVALAAVRTPWRLSQPLTAILAAMLVATGAGLVQGGATAKAAVEKEGPFGDLVQDPDAFGMGPGLWLAYLATIILLAAAVHAIVQLRRPSAAAPADPFAGALPAPTPAQPAQEPPEPSEEPSRQLTCPRCKHQFAHTQGAPTCPSCGYSRAATVK